MSAQPKNGGTSTEDFCSTFSGEEEEAFASFDAATDDKLAGTFGASGFALTSVSAVEDDFGSDLRHDHPITAPVPDCE